MKAWVSSLALFTAACASSPGIVDTGAVRVAGADDLPRPTAEDYAQTMRPHLLGPFDELEVVVFGIPELSREKVRIDANGQVLLPLAGAVDVGGKTPAEAADRIATALRGKGVRNPQVTINETETLSQVVTVDGAVKMPGIYPIAGNMTLLRAIARAQGTTEAAHSRHVLVFRTVGGQKYAALYDLRAIRQAAYRDPDLFPNDLVVVSESEARRLFPVISQAAGALLNPLVLLVR